MKIKLLLSSVFLVSNLAYSTHIKEGECSHVQETQKEELEIYTIQKFREIDAHLNTLSQSKPRSKIHLVFDIDNTILTPDLDDIDINFIELAYRATDGFYYQAKNEYLRMFKESDPENAKQRAYRSAVDEWNEVVSGVYGQVPYKLVDPDFVSWLNEKHEEGHPSMAHTAREPVLESVTVKQLASFGIDFSLYSPFDGHKATLDLPPEPALFHNGIYIVGRGGISALHHKGNQYMNLLDLVRAPHQRDFIVVFVDDRREHVEGMVKILKQDGIRCVGFHITTISAETEHK